MRDRERPRERLFSVTILLIAEKHVNKGYKTFFFIITSVHVITHLLKGGNLSTVIVIQGSGSRGSFMTTRCIASPLHRGAKVTGRLIYA